VNVLLSRIDVPFSYIAHFQCAYCGQSIASTFVEGLLVSDSTAFAVITSAGVEEVI
jgi:hypothetical protein